MAVTAKPAIGTIATVAAAGTPVQPTTAIPDNCHTVIVYNPNAAATVLVAFVANAAAFVAASAVPVPAGTAMTLAIGPASQRPQQTGTLLFVDATVNGSTANITYVNGLAL
jgi:hypothetical protein